MNAIEKVTRYLEWKRKQNTCNHTSAGGTFRYFGEGPGAVRVCRICGREEVCFNPDPVNNPQYVQWGRSMGNYSRYTVESIREKEENDGRSDLRTGE